MLNIVAGEKHDSPWGQKNLNGCSKSQYDHAQDASGEEICVMMPTDKMAYTYTVCELMEKKLWDAKDIVTIHIGLGACKTLLDQEGRL